MRRILILLILSLLVVPILGGCLREPRIPSADSATGNLTLTLPETRDPPRHAPERITTLTVDGKDFSKPLATKRTLDVKPAQGTDSVTIVYSYWPNTYTNVIRTRKVVLPKDRAISVDMTNEDPGQPDKLKPIYFPTPIEVVEAMCKLAKVGPDDVVHDIGSGDGRLVIHAVKKFGAKKGFGIDIDKDLVAKSMESARAEKVADRVEFRHGDALEIKDFSEASVVLLYVGERLNLKLRPVLQKTLKPGSRVVSHRFLMGDWKADDSITIKAKNNFNEDEKYDLHLWTIR